MSGSGRFLPQTRRLAVLVPPGVQLVGVVGFYEVFDAVNRILASRGRAPAYDLRLAGIEDRTPSASGLALHTGPVDAVEAAHTVVVCGTLEDTAHTDPRLLAAVDRLARTAERVVSLCVGAFVLGELGWLDGRRCTTHWLELERLRARFPLARVEPDAIFTEDGPVLTSAGATAGIDLALHMVRLDLGPRMALAVARVLVMFAQRPGGQSQFGSALRIRPGTDERLQRLVSRVLNDPGGDHTIDALAASVGMSPRHFARVFRAETGETPAAFVSRARVEAAQRALAQSDAPIPTIAEDCGFGTPETLRRTFQRVVGVSPSAWRERFRA
ncbi:MAG: GlxA family transcriptional regulator [Alphaproteobacteria bacterium]|nr:GlxA family transcriptional regulator [Alphaproteobacteria bacterium]